MSLEEHQGPNSVDPAPDVVHPAGTPSATTDFFIQSSMELSEDLRGTGRNEEDCRVDATPPSSASRLKFSIHRILGFDDLPQTGSHLSTTSGVSALPRIFIRCLGDGEVKDEDRCDSSGRLTAEEEDDDEDDMLVEREDHQEFKCAVRDGSGCEDQAPPHPPLHPPLSTSSSTCSPSSSQRLSWLQCTRYKPPKLPSQFQFYFS